MSDLASQKALASTSPHLPLSWYFDPKVAELEQKLLFARGPGYVGHEQMVPEPGSYRVLDWRSSGAWSLVNNDGRVTIGAPIVAQASVVADVVEHRRGRKKITFKMKRRKGYHKTIGHRQELTVVKIKEIKA